ncbi:MAG: ATP-binding protein [Leptospiraceae bacterium]|nr:ATP-binding protein [Leptospiraceae bacterium]
MIETIFRNLISNAIKFTKEGGEIQVLISTKGNFIEIIVADNGIGIQRDFLTNLLRIIAINLPKERKEKADPVLDSFYAKILFILIKEQFP